MWPNRPEARSDRTTRSSRTASSLAASAASAPHPRKDRSSRPQGRYARPRTWRLTNPACYPHGDEAVEQHATAGTAVTSVSDSADSECGELGDDLEGKFIARPII